MLAIKMPPYTAYENTAGARKGMPGTDLRERSWFGVLKRTIKEFREDNLTDWAAALTYYAVLSVFPALIALLSIVGLVADPATITRVLTDTISSLGPASAVDTFKGPIEGLITNKSDAGILLVIGLATALWSAPPVRRPHAFTPTDERPI